MADLQLVYSAISDVGRVRKDNQDSGYAGPWLLAVADGVGGAARGDIASSAAIQQIRKLDEQPTDDLLAQVAGALHRAHDRIGELVDHDPALNGTSTTAVVALFDGTRLGVGHVGDSRGYLLRQGTLRQFTTDHTFVQTLIDDGRITEDEARTHPHKNLILKAIDSVHEVEPDLFHVDLEVGDRVLLCSDGILSITDARIADIMSTGTADYAAVELVRAALEAGSHDNVTCIIADVVAADHEMPDDLVPLLVGAAAELPRRLGRGSSHRGGRFRGHRSGDTGELEPVQAEIPDAVGSEVAWAIDDDPVVDPEAARYAPRPPERFVGVRRLLVAAVLVGLLWVGIAAAWSWSQQQYYVGAGTGTNADVVMIYRGLNADLPGIDLSQPFESSNVSLDLLSDYQAGQVRDGIDADSLDDARQTVQNLSDTQESPPETAS
ncbi:MAG: PP2C family protein-serine/threonine phosphatase [Nocardioides sp.]